MSRPVRGLLGQWWAGRTDYLWIADYFRPRGLDRVVRMVMAALAAVLTLAAFLMLVSMSGPNTRIGDIVVAASAGVGVAVTLFWALGGWPSRRMSVAMVIGCDAGIPAVCWSYADRFVGLYGMNTLALVALYVVLFHGPKLLAVHCCWAAAVLTVFAVASAVTGEADPVAMTAQGLVSGVICVVIPPILQFGLWMVRADADDAMRDPLTGLLNRRGLYLHVGDLLPAVYAAGDKADVVLMVVDLDRFKVINDSHGHRTGDEILIRSTHRIKSAVRTGALLARIGGEEFVLVDVLPGDDVVPVAERLRAALAGSGDRVAVTASVGVSRVAGHVFRAVGADHAVLLDRLFDAADRAMYKAKRNGRDCVVADPTAVDAAHDVDTPPRLGQPPEV